MLALSGLFLIGLFGVATLGSQLQGLRARLGGARVAEVSPPPVSRVALGSGTMLTAGELWGLYNLDPAKADARFKDKSVEVTGTVSEVRRDFHGNFLLRLGAGQPFDSVRATLLGRVDGAHPVPARNQIVALRCMGRGAVIGAPLLESCVTL